MTRHRKGLGQARLRVTGRASHAGNAHEEGVSAIHELSHKIVEIEKLTDYDQQTTVNVGLVQGGEARNTISPCAEAYVDLRYPNNDLGNRLVTEIKRIAAIKHTRNTHIGQSPETETWVKLHRPAKPIHPESDAIISAAMGISAALGQTLGSRYSGGGTDGSIMQSVGLPTADSLGPDGEGDHSPREESSISSLMIRTKMNAVLLSRLIQD
jgi:glutamate carboxypeptidase